MEHIKNNIGCLILQVTLPESFDEISAVINSERYDKLATNTINSLKKFHPEIDLYYVTDKNIKEYKSLYLKEFYWSNSLGINRYVLAYNLMKHFNYDKMIILGCDTIVCSRMDEFLDNNDDVLATLNYYIQESTDYWKTPVIEVDTPKGRVIEHLNINADVVCFNNSKALKKVIELSMEHFTHFQEQGGLNELAWVDKSFNVKIVDSPYVLSDVSYNCRAKGVPRCDMIDGGVLKNCYPNNVHGFSYSWLVERNLLDGQPTPIKSWYVKDNKLFTHEHKQIKCFHFVEGLGGRPVEKFNELINDFKYKWFNEETIKFFKEECNCTEFFN